MEEEEKENVRGVLPLEEPENHLLRQSQKKRKKKPKEHLLKIGREVPCPMNARVVVDRAEVEVGKEKEKKAENKSFFCIRHREKRKAKGRGHAIANIRILCDCLVMLQKS